MDDLDRMLVEWRCRRLSIAHAYFLDHGDFEEMVDLFTPDGVFDRAGRVHRGQEEIRAAMAARPAITTRHIMSNLHFSSVTPDDAVSVAYVVTYHAEGVAEGPVPYATAAPRTLEFDTAYRRTPAGWRLASVVAAPVFTPSDWSR